MEGRADVEVAKKIFGQNFIGPEEIARISSKLNVILPNQIPDINYTIPELEKHATDSILILGIDQMFNGKTLNLLNLREAFGVDPDSYEPCFYNQDWYLNESFMKTTLKSKWYLIKTNLFEESRAVLPEILNKNYRFPSAILCAYTFFAYYFHNNNLLWKHDFVWCLDVDHNGDRIYVGKYSDVDEINKNGFSIHRHLALRKSYGAISIY